MENRTGRHFGVSRRGVDGVLTASALPGACGRFERECDDDGSHEQGEGNRVVPGHLLLEKQDGEADKNRQRYRFLNDLQLETGEGAESQTIGRYRKAIFQQSDEPGNQDGFPQRPGVAVFEVAIPCECHEDIRKEQ